MGVLERPGSLRGDPERDLHGELASRRSRSRRLSPSTNGMVNQSCPAVVPGVVHGEDMRVLEAGDRLDLALEALGAERLGQLGVQHLERHRALVPEVVGQKDGGHAAPPQLAFEPVAVSQAALELLAEVRHP